MLSHLICASHSPLLATMSLRRLCMYKADCRKAPLCTDNSVDKVMRHLSPRKRYIKGQGANCGGAPFLVLHLCPSFELNFTQIILLRLFRQPELATAIVLHFIHTLVEFLKLSTSTSVWVSRHPDVDNLLPPFHPAQTSTTSRNNRFSQS